MKKIYNLTLLSLILAGAVIMTSCGKKIASSASGAGNLEYVFTGNKAYSYTQASAVTQSIVFGGQDINTSVISELGFTATGKGIAGGSLILEIAVDTFGVSFSGMGTSMKEDMKDLKGKSFMMTMDPKGDNKDLDEAKSMTYTVGGVQTSDLKESFMMIFPELPKENVQIGYTWQDTDTLNINTDSETAEMIINSNNTVESREEFAGYDCYKINYTVSGTRDGSSQTPQGLIIMNLDISGTGYYYFAINEGIIVSDNVDLKMDGDLIIPTGDTVPIYMTTKSDLILK